MASRPAKPVILPDLRLSPDDIGTGIVRLSKRLDEVNKFNVSEMKEMNPPELTGLEASISKSLARTFGENTPRFKRFAAAGQLRWRPMYVNMNGRGYPLNEAQAAVQRNIGNSVALLEGAIKSLEEERDEVVSSSSHNVSIITAPSRDLSKVFVVHGHDDGAREAVARFLERLGIQPIILHEQANQGRTVIEKVEAHGEVGFAVILLTPDDVGCVDGGTPTPRARQNVVLELGYFIGRLGRKHVCALKRGEVEIPSDFAGVVYETFDDGGGWRQKLAAELQAADFKIDWNNVMRA